MSRVEDDREAARLAERMLLKRRNEQGLQQDLKANESTFAKKMDARLCAGEHAKDEGAVSQLQESLESQEADALQLGARGHQALAEKSSFNRGQAHSFGEAMAHGRLGEEQQLADRRQGDVTKEGSHLAGRASARGASEDRELSRRERAKVEGSAAAVAHSSGEDEGAAKSDADGGGGQGGQDQRDGQKAGLHFNPALLAPVPLAQPKEVSGSTRIRALAQEIVQKIVDRVRLGKNLSGHSEFQIDLRSDVLSGLTIRVSGDERGRIKAVFSGNDPQVLKLLKEHSEGLKAALQARGLSLEELKVEARA